MAGLFSSKKEQEFQGQLASLGLAVEALEAILVEQGVLREGQVMEVALKMANQKLRGAKLMESLEFGRERFDG